MTELDALAKAVGSRRYAQDLLDGAPGRVLTQPWWNMPNAAIPIKRMTDMDQGLQRTLINKDRRRS